MNSRDSFAGLAFPLQGQGVSSSITATTPSGFRLGNESGRSHSPRAWPTLEGDGGLREETHGARGSGPLPGRGCGGRAEDRQLPQSLLRRNRNPVANLSPPLVSSFPPNQVVVTPGCLQWFPWVLSLPSSPPHPAGHCRLHPLNTQRDVPQETSVTAETSQDLGQQPGGS